MRYIDLDSFIKYLNKSGVFNGRHKFNKTSGEFIQSVSLPVPVSATINILDHVPKQYNTYRYGINNICILTDSEFKLDLIIGGSIIEIIDSNYLLPNENKYLKLTEQLVLINSILKLLVCQLKVVTNDTSAMILFDIVKHGYYHMPKSSLIYERHFINDSMISQFSTICNIIYVWVTDASYVTIKLTRNNMYTKQKLIKHEVDDLWYLTFNDPSSGNITKSVKLCMCEITSLDTDGVIIKVRTDNYNVLDYMYNGLGRGKNGIRLMGFRYSN